MKKVSMIIIILLILTSVAYASQPHFKLQIDAPDEIFEDEILEANISVTDYVYGEENPTSAIDFSVSYNHEHFEYIGYTTKDGLHTNIGQSVSEDVYQNQRILIGVIGSVNVISEDSNLITLNFRPKSMAYKTPFTLHSAKASTPTGLLFTPEVTSKKITIANIYDVNKDGLINIGDVGIVAYNIGNDPIKHYYADINRDGVIDTNDVDILMKYIINNDSNILSINK